MLSSSIIYATCCGLLNVDFFVACKLNMLMQRAQANLSHRRLQANNVVVKKSVNPPREESGLMSHVDLVQMLDIVDLEQGTTVAGKSLHVTSALAACYCLQMHELFVPRVCLALHVIAYAAVT